MSGQMLGFVGVGRMGGPMASRLLDAGYALSVFDTSADAVKPLAARGATVAASPEDVASAAEIVLMSLPTPAIVQTVALGDRGVCPGLEGHDTGRFVHDRARDGHRRGARAGRTADRAGRFAGQRRRGRGEGRHAGGHGVLPEADLRRRRADPQAFRPPVLHRREAGPRPDREARQQPARRRRARRLLRGARDGRQGRPRPEGADRHHQRRQRPQQRDPGQVPARRSSPGTFDFGFATGLSYKDVRLCVDEAEALGVPMVVGAAVRQMLAITNARFGPDSDFTSIARVVEEWAGVEIRG